MKDLVLVFDIGGVILDDSDKPLRKILGCSKERMSELMRVAFDDERWREGVMIGEFDQVEYMGIKMAEFPEMAQELKVVLDPAMQAETLPLNWEVVNLLKDEHARRGQGMYWLSNMGRAEYDYLEGEGIIGMLDGGCFSCEEGTKKPRENFYEILFKRYNLTPDKCVFFDDRERNLVVAEKLGMKTVLVKSPEDVYNNLVNITKLS